MVKVKKVAMLPNLFISVTYDNGEQRYFRSKSNEMEVNSLNGQRYDGDEIYVTGQKHLH